MIYLDSAATTPMDPEIISSFQDYMRDQFANSGAVYGIGLDSKKKIEEAAERIAFALGIPTSHKVIFTSGGTESDNTALRGAASALKHTGNHIITQTTEHHAILHACEELEKSGLIMS